jgi:3-phosphoshikimate 1-carboxyvinyltransferase
MVWVDGGQRLRAITAPVPGDVSSALFWLVLAAGTPGADLTIEGVGLNPSRTAVFEVLRRAGARLDVTPDGQSAGEPAGNIRVQFHQPVSFEIAPEDVPLMIDEIPGLAALAAMQPGVTMTVRGAKELRVKESDRIAMLARGFHALGIRGRIRGRFHCGGPPSGGRPMPRTIITWRWRSRSPATARRAVTSPARRRRRVVSASSTSSTGSPE